MRYVSIVGSACDLHVSAFVFLRALIYLWGLYYREIVTNWEVAGRYFWELLTTVKCYRYLSFRGEGGLFSKLYGRTFLTQRMRKELTIIHQSGKL